MTRKLLQFIYWNILLFKMLIETYNEYRIKHTFFSELQALSLSVSPPMYWKLYIVKIAEPKGRVDVC